jgi:hypothetical protein
MRSSIFLLFFLITIFSGCNQNVSEKGHDGEKSLSLEKELHLFLTKFKVLPEENMNLHFEGSDKKLPKLDSKTSDTLFVSYAEGSRAYGMLSDTSQFYFLLWYQAVENVAFMMSIIDKEGVVVDEKMLNTGQYGWDCGYQWHGKVFIFMDKTIVMRDSIVTYDCDMGPASDSTWKFEIDSMTGIVQSNGKIEFSKLKKGNPELIK